MLKFDVSRGAALAGALLIVMAAMDVLFGGDSAGAVHAVVGGLGAGLLAISAAAGAGR